MHAVDQLLREAGGITAVSRLLQPNQPLGPHAIAGMGFSRSRSVKVLFFVAQSHALYTCFRFLRVRSQCSNEMCVSSCMQSSAMSVSTVLCLPQIYLKRVLLILFIESDYVHVMLLALCSAVLCAKCHTLQFFASRSLGC